MLEFAKGGTVPPGGVFFYSDPENNVAPVQNRGSLSSLIRDVRAAYVSANRPCPEPLGRIVEDYICRHVPPGFCMGTTNLPRARTLTPQETKANTQRVAISYGRADPGTIRRRLAICGVCSENTRTLCLSCTGLTDWAVRLAGRTRVAQDDSMGVCACDKVLVSLLVSVGMPAAAPDGVRPETCWRLSDDK